MLPSLIKIAMPHIYRNCDCFLYFVKSIRDLANHIKGEINIRFRYIELANLKAYRNCVIHFSLSDIHTAILINTVYKIDLCLVISTCNAESKE